MSAPAEDLDRALRRVHRSVLATLGVCAVVVAAGAAAERGESMPAPPPGYLVGAVVLALGSIVCGAPARRGPPLSPGAVRSLLAGLLCAGGIGLLGVLMALAESLWRAGLLYTVAALLLALRPPPRVAGGDPPIRQP